MSTIALLGCGLMGTPMAHRFLAAGLPLIVWNRSRHKAEALAAHGAQVANTAAQAVASADIVITMLEHGDVVREVLFDSTSAASQTLRPGTLVIDMSSILPEQAQAHARQLADMGIPALDAPVSGGTLGAEAGTLAIMVGGEEAAFLRALPVFQHLGRAVHVGPAGAGQLTKLANQMIVGITIGAVAEALLLAERGGANPAKVREALRGGFAESRVLEVHGQRMVAQDFTKRAALTIQLKDMRNAMHEGERLGIHSPITGLLTQLYDEAVNHGLADQDQAALQAWLRQRKRP